MILAVAAVFVPWAITVEPGAEAESASFGQSPARKKLKSLTSGRIPSFVIVPGTDVNQVGGSTIAASVSGYAPVIRPVPDAVFPQLMIPLRPAPLRFAAVRPATWPPPVRKFAPLVSPPT